MTDESIATPPAAGEDQATTEAAAAADTATASAAQPEESLPEVLPALAIGGSVLYPLIAVPYVSVEARDIAAIDEATARPDRMLVLAPQRLMGEDGYTGELQDYATAGTILRMARLPQGGVQAILQGLVRVRVREVVQQEPGLRVRIERLEDRLEPSTELEALQRGVIENFQKIVALTEGLPNELGMTVANIPNPGNLADFVAANVNLKPEERLAVLSETGITERLRLVHSYLLREAEVLEVGQKIRAQVQSDMDKRQREFVLREQLAAIQRELGDEERPELADLRRRLDDAHLPENIRKEADRELERLILVNQASAEYNVIRTFLEWLAELPWSQSTDERIDIGEAARVLEEDHYGLTKVKQRILDYLAVRKLRADTRGPILCLVGPPGVGKTSLGQSIARATGRHFVRLALGGVRDEAEIRGFRRTYVGAQPGRILQELRRTAVNNPLMLLDEVDKLASDYRGDPASALLELLDPAQNNTFTDHYLDLPFDLSKTLFICTANQLDGIPGPLRDRMEILMLEGYTEREKLEIAKRYLLPRQLKENGLAEGQVVLSDAVIFAIIRGYTREAGVRGLERAVGTVCRRFARRVAEHVEQQVGAEPPNTAVEAQSAEPTDVVAEKSVDTSRGTLHDEVARPATPVPPKTGGSLPAVEQAFEVFTVAVSDLPELLGMQPLPDDLLVEQDEVGVVTGMAATSTGGDVLLIEAVAVPGKGGFSFTGRLGDVMQESARAAMTYARRRAPDFDVPVKYFEQHDIHIHVPEGAVPKDGPSAGVTMATAILSAITKRPVRRDVSMTGEISLRGRVLPVGGIKEKVLAAHRAGIRAIIIPKDNARDLDDVPKDLREQITFTLAQHVDDVIGVALTPAAKKRSRRIDKAEEGRKPAPLSESAGRPKAARGRRAAS